MEENEFAAYLRNRPAQLEEAKKNGIKIVGYFPGNFVPEEMIHAAGAIPICLTHSSPRAADKGLSVVPQFICPFARAQIGERLLKENPYYNLIDMVIAPITCQHLRKVAEIWEYYGDPEIFKLGIPHQSDYEFQEKYLVDRLNILRERLQLLTGNEINDDRLSRGIDLYNRMRDLFRKISLLRQTSNPALSGKEFLRLNHASFYADPEIIVDYLESVYEKFKDNQRVDEESRHRIILLGPNIGDDDYAVPELIEAAGGDIVIEEICEGVRYYWNNVENKGDLIRCLVKGYLTDRLPCAFMRNSSKKRLDFTMELIKDFNVSAVIWYELLCCETYDSEAYYFSRRMGESNIPMLVLESDYSAAPPAQFKTRIEAFMEIMKGVLE